MVDTSLVYGARVLLHLVRHAPSHPEPGLPADRWRLTDDAVPAVDALRRAGVLPQSARWVSSPEPKALATAQLLTSEPVEEDHRLVEHVRDATWFDDHREFVSCVRRAFGDPAGRAIPGWEPLDATRVRLLDAVADVVPGSEPTVLVGHGTAWTLLVAELTGRAPDLLAWEAMTMPDHCLLDLSERRLVSPWGGWRGLA